MSLPDKTAATALLEKHVLDEYQRHHALMVATAMEGYAGAYDGDPHLWYVTGLLHDIDFEEFPDLHPAESIKWFRQWGYPDDLIHAVEAHAYGYHGLHNPSANQARCGTSRVRRDLRGSFTPTGS